MLVVSTFLQVRSVDVNLSVVGPGIGPSSDWMELIQAHLFCFTLSYLHKKQNPSLIRFFRF
jgi:hypothetical protein